MRDLEKRVELLEKKLKRSYTMAGILALMLVAGGLLAADGMTGEFDELKVKHLILVGMDGEMKGDLYSTEGGSGLVFYNGQGAMRVGMTTSDTDGNAGFWVLDPNKKDETNAYKKVLIALGNGPDAGSMLGLFDSKGLIRVSAVVSPDDSKQALLLISQKAQPVMVKPLSYLNEIIRLQKLVKKYGEDTPQ